MKCSTCGKKDSFIITPPDDSGHYCLDCLLKENKPSASKNLPTVVQIREWMEQYCPPDNCSINLESNQKQNK